MLKLLDAAFFFYIFTGFLDFSEFFLSKGDKLFRKPFCSDSIRMKFPDQFSVVAFYPVIGITRRAAKDSIEVISIAKIQGFVGDTRPQSRKR
jgi:hypothetical protein